MAPGVDLRGEGGVSWEVEMWLAFFFLPDEFLGCLAVDRI